MNFSVLFYGRQFARASLDMKRQCELSRFIRVGTSFFGPGYPKTW